LTDPDPDLAQTLQNRIIAGLKAGRVDSEPLKQLHRPDGHHSLGDLEVYIATLEKAVAEAEVLSERWRQEAETAVKRVEPLEANIAALEKALAEAEVLSERWRQEAETAVKRVETLDANITELEEAVTKAEAVAEQQRQDAKVATKRADDLVAELFEVTSEHIEMSTRIAEQAAKATRADSV
jgi:chromosome segregation ATPase